MNQNVWADTWETAVRTAIGEDGLLFAGHNDLAAGGIAHLTITPGKATAMVTARHGRDETHTVITVPVLTGEQAAAVHGSSSHCGHHRELRAGGLPGCLADPGHSGKVPVAPIAAEIGFACTCGASPCRHVAALAHAVTRRLSARPEELAVLRGLSPQPTPAPDTSTAPAGTTTTRTTPEGQLYVAAHHVWGWYRECAQPPRVCDHPPAFAGTLASTSPSWPPPPAPAPPEQRLHALLDDAAEQARNYLLSGTALECSRDGDAVRLASTLPQARLPEIADRLGLDISQLRERLTMHRATGNTASP
uniref:SWIM-type domain-containing protein n=1 Tax=Streptomyces sp. NBC_00093 TaxID=2975649 RepID=A0AAU2ABT1_9ACTN